MGMEVLVGPTFGIDVRSRSGVAVVPAAAEQRVVATCLFLKDGVGSNRDEAGSVFGIDQAGKPAEPEEDSSDSTSSIGAASEDEDNDEVTSKDVQSGFTGGVFGSFGSLEDSLPIKRGLSNHFTGKSKSFANLSEVCNVKDVKDLEKPENAFNKRRRLLVATKLCSKRSSFYGSLNPKSMPLLALKEDEDEDEEDEVEQQQQQERQGHSLLCSPSSSPSSSSSSSEKKEQEYYGEHQQRLPKKLLHRRLLNFKSRSCFSLSDLQEHDEQDEDD